MSSQVDSRPQFHHFSYPSQHNFSASSISASARLAEELDWKTSFSKPAVSAAQEHPLKRPAAEAIMEEADMASSTHYAGGKARNLDRPPLPSERAFTEDRQRSEVNAVRPTGSVAGIQEREAKTWGLVDGGDELPHVDRLPMRTKAGVPVLMRSMPFPQNLSSPFPTPANQGAREPRRFHSGGSLAPGAEEKELGREGTSSVITLPPISALTAGLPPHANDRGLGAERSTLTGRLATPLIPGPSRVGGSILLIETPPKTSPKTSRDPAAHALSASPIPSAWNPSSFSSQTYSTRPSSPASIAEPGTGTVTASLLTKPIFPEAAETSVIGPARRRFAGASPSSPYPAPVGSRGAGRARGWTIGSGDEAESRPSPPGSLGKHERLSSGEMVSQEEQGSEFAQLLDHLSLVRDVNRRNGIIAACDSPPPSNAVSAPVAEGKWQVISMIQNELEALKSFSPTQADMVAADIGFRRPSHDDGGAARRIPIQYTAPSYVDHANREGFHMAGPTFPRRSGAWEDIQDSDMKVRQPPNRQGSGSSFNDLRPKSPASLSAQSYSPNLRNERRLATSLPVPIHSTHRASNFDTNRGDRSPHLMNMVPQGEAPLHSSGQIMGRRSPVHLASATYPRLDERQRQQLELLDRRRLTGKGMKRVRKRKNEHHQECLGCQAKETPEWRKGPMGPRTLCNACGLLYAKLTRRKQQEAEAAAKASGKSPEEISKEMDESPMDKQASLEALRAELNLANGLRNRPPQPSMMSTDTMEHRSPHLQSGYASEAGAMAGHSSPVGVLKDSGSSITSVFGPGRYGPSLASFDAQHFDRREAGTLPRPFDPSSHSHAQTPLLNRRSSLAEYGERLHAGSYEQRFFTAEERRTANDPYGAEVRASRSIDHRGRPQAPPSHWGPMRRNPSATTDWPMDHARRGDVMDRSQYSPDRSRYSP
ncbi:hypothetical protein IE53DRAFT_244307 [Violaceomyces palustris]|uniref:Uncharacterized protein n=1 Tax=Violaceomyces palustris TaxID=1673888 RepID=A0ACD0NP58_9BASI|nr:hypothetical protein IE53DRAFT_244307 [Violaceomyces palustris]